MNLLTTSRKVDNMKINTHSFYSEKIHTELKMLRQIINWRFEPEFLSGIKDPVDKDGNLIDVNNRENWLTMNEAKEVSNNIGFVLTEDDPYLCIHLDGALYGDKMCDLEKEIIDMLPNTYVEKDAASTGLYFIYKLNRKPDIHRYRHINVDGFLLEIYWSNTSVICSGYVYSDYPVSVLNAADIESVVNRFVNGPLAAYGDPESFLCP